ncbi:hypothetical protein E1293_29500 [Actinomadura darangshiensis]|uniref:Uncharacterized protein n=1 Tax=Actinomadura darangshiensis TaxID=705336 RepID=A0A4R5ANW3_9ACTN|nr:hypothetical protein [Actinomadura darangshiensis]TDD74491.1 hypothetical protein E1293_29500 [Actinomadura darangshiensis]
MTPWKTPLAAAAALLLAAGLASPVSAATRGDFRPVSLPFFWPNNYLYDVDAASPDSVWISGVQGELVVPGTIPGTGRTIPGNPVVRRWKNGGWVEYGLQGLPARATITDVDTAGAEDVWIDGTRFDGDANVAGPYLGHFTGSRFDEVALPAASRTLNLQASGAGVWATVDDGGVYRRTGGTWTHVTTLPNVYLRTFHIRADDDIWVLGTPGQYDRTLEAHHWDGRSWTRVPVDQPPEGINGITDMVAVSPTEAWAVGVSYRTSPSTPVLVHWDGTSWSSVTPPPGLNALTRIVKGGDGTLWALGHLIDEPAKPGLLRYSGGTWERVATTAVPNRSNIYPNGLAVVPGTGALWTLGSVNIGGPTLLTDG